MNKLPAVIKRIERSDALYLLEVEAGGVGFTLLLFDLKPMFIVGTRVNILFKESEVAVAVDLIGELSLANRLAARVSAVKCGPILTHLTLTCAAGEMGSLITTRALERLRLQVGGAVTALIKASEISLEAADGN